MSTTLRLSGAVILSVIAFILWAITSPSTTIEPIVAEPESAVVTRVIDGDTIVITGAEKVRLIGINTPEFYGDSESNECFALEAKSLIEQLILGKSIRLESDVSQTDKYNRLLRYVYIENSPSSDAEDVSVNEILVQEGFARARAFPPDTKLQAELKGLERNAQENKLGLWGVCE